jgi:hypothetical protein
MTSCSNRNELKCNGPRVIVRCVGRWHSVVQSFPSKSAASSMVVLLMKKDPQLHMEKFGSRGVCHAQRAGPYVSGDISPLLDLLSDTEHGDNEKRKGSRYPTPLSLSAHQPTLNLIRRETVLIRNSVLNCAARFSTPQIYYHLQLTTLHHGFYPKSIVFSSFRYIRRDN